MKKVSVKLFQKLAGVGGAHGHADCFFMKFSLARAKKGAGSTRGRKHSCK